MATVTRTTTFVDGNTLTAAQLNNEFNNLLNALGLVNSDIASNAAISLSKLAGSSQGAIPYDNGSTIVTLAPGTSGQFLQTQGAGQNPVWGGGIWTTYTPTITGVTGPSGNAKYAQIGNMCFVLWINVGGTSNSANFTVTLPITPTLILNAGGYDYYADCGIQDNSSIQNNTGVIGIQANVAAATIGKTYSTIGGNVFGGFTSSGTKTISAQFFYPTA